MEVTNIRESRNIIEDVVIGSIADELGIRLDFISYKQETEEGSEMREWIVRNVKFLDRDKMLKKFREWNVNK